MPTPLTRRPGRLLVDASLWSADLGALAAEVRRVAPYVDLFHVDVSDTRFVPDALLFPDLITALRPHTTLRFHVHLMAHRALDLVDVVAEAGAALITVHVEADDVAPALRRVREHGAAAGLALTVSTPPAAVVPHLGAVDHVVMVGTPIGTRGTPMDPQAPPRIAELRRLLDEHQRGGVPVIADGGIRPYTVPALAAAGADAVVAGSMLFGAQDPAAVVTGLHRPRVGAAR